MRLPPLKREPTMSPAELQAAFAAEDAEGKWAAAEPFSKEWRRQYACFARQTEAASRVTSKKGRARDMSEDLAKQIVSSVSSMPKMQLFDLWRKSKGVHMACLELSLHGV